MSNSRPIRRLRAEARRPRMSGSRTAISLKLSRDGEALAGGLDGFELFLWNMTSGARRTFSVGCDSICGLAFTNAGRQLIASGHYNDTISTLDTRSGKVDKFDEHRNSVYHLSISASGDRLVSAARAGFIGVWDLGRRTRLRLLRAPSHDARGNPSRDKEDVPAAILLS